jgi:hypothetical protein
MIKNILIAYHMLESSLGAYLELLSNKLDVTAKTVNTRMHAISNASLQQQLNS